MSSGLLSGMSSGLLSGMSSGMSSGATDLSPQPTTARRCIRR